MTEREAWQKTLAENPEDFHLRGVYADWLDDHGEHDLAAGYRALCLLKRRPKFYRPDYDPHRPWEWWCDNMGGTDGWHVLPAVWSNEVGHHHVQQTLQGAEDVVALAWSRLTPEQQAKAVEVLTPQVAVSA